MEWTPPPDGIAVCQGGGVTNPRRRRRPWNRLTSSGSIWRSAAFNFTVLGRTVRSRSALGGVLLGQIADLDAKIGGLEKELRACARQDEQAARLMTIPGIGPINAMALQAFAPPMESFRRGRDFSAWLGLVPRQHTTGGKPRLGRISKMGQRDLRRLLIIGAKAVVNSAVRRGETNDPWLARMLARKPRMLVAVALANKMARIVWALMTRKETYRGFAPAAA